MNKVLAFTMILAALLAGCEKQELIDPAGFELTVNTDTVIFAEIGDFGFAGSAEKAVADMVKSWNPDFIVSAGDNNYYEGKLSTIKSNISQYYGDYIYNYDAPSEYRCNGQAFVDKVNRFFPTPGNHDADNRDGLIPYYNYFTLPGNEQYYKFVWGPVTFFSINTAQGNLTQQKEWLLGELENVNTPFKIVFFHHPAYSSGGHGCFEAIQWDFFNMGIDLIFSGHDHHYERIQKVGEEGTTYIVNGLGGKDTSNGAALPLSASLFRTFFYGEHYGAVKVRANQTRLILEFYNVVTPEVPIDIMEINK